ncbi:MAG: hypothetical protein ACTHNS_03785 [Marmoricola sp.]
MTAWNVGALAATVADVITAVAVVVAVLLWLRFRSWSPTIPVFLELLLAAGLLRLGAADTWRAIAGAAAIVAIRTLVKTAGSATAGRVGPTLPGAARRRRG